MTRTISVMQPYFFPYGGYFRLLAGADIFVIYDCVQFPRRGFVHRNRFKTADGSLAWLTLPIAPCDRTTRIADLVFQENAQQKFLQRLRRFPALSKLIETGVGVPPDLASLLVDFDRDPVTYLEQTLRATAAVLGLHPRIVRSSTMGLADSLRAEERVLSIVKQLGGQRYLNAPGGRALYDPARFGVEGIDLAFLPPFDGPAESSLDIMCRNGVSALRDMVVGV